MANYREILRLHSLGSSQRSIAGIKLWCLITSESIRQRRQSSILQMQSLWYFIGNTTLMTSIIPRRLTWIRYH